MASSDFGAFGRFQLAGPGDLGHAAVLEQNVLGGVDAGGGIDEVAVANRESGHARPPCPLPSSARSTTAMRIATPLRHLFEDGRLRAVGHAGGDLQAADDGPRMHHDCRRRVRGQPLAGELVAGLVLVQIELQPGEPLGLDAQHHDHLRLAQRGFEVALDR